jgi:hypothetical protein
MTPIPELDSMWKEKKDAEKVDIDDTFVPAKEAPLDKDNALVHIEL